MTTTRLLPIALAALLSAPALAQEQAQVPADPQPADEPVAVEPVASFEPVDENPTVVDPADTIPPPETDADVDRRCLEQTGSRVTADPQPATPKDQSERDGEDCAIGNGTVYTRDDLDRTGETTVEEALESLDPRVF